MKFAEVLPHLEAGRRVRSDGCVYRLNDYGILTLCLRNGTDVASASAKLTRDDWEVVEEPAPAKPAHDGCGESWCKENGGTPCPPRVRAMTDLRDQVARLTRERDEAAAKATRFEQRLDLARGRIRDLAEDWGK